MPQHFTSPRATTTGPTGAKTERHHTTPDTIATNQSHAWTRNSGAQYRMASARRQLLHEIHVPAKLVVPAGSITRSLPLDSAHHRNELPGTRAGPQVRRSAIRGLGRVQALDRRSNHVARLFHRITRRLHLRRPWSSLHRVPIKLHRRRDGSKDKRDHLARRTPDKRGRCRCISPGLFRSPGRWSWSEGLRIRPLNPSDSHQSLARSVQHDTILHPGWAESAHVESGSLGACDNPALDCYRCRYRTVTLIVNPISARSHQ